MSSLVHAKNLFENTQALNTIFGSEEYGDFVRKFVGYFNKEKSYEFQVNHNGLGGNKIVKNERGFNIGYIPSGLTDQEIEQITPKTINFFMQRSAFAYSRYEIVTANINDLFVQVLRDNGIYAETKETRALSKKTIFNLIEDFIN